MHKSKTGKVVVRTELPLFIAPEPCQFEAINIHDFIQLSSHRIPNFKGKSTQTILENLMLIEFVV